MTPCIHGTYSKLGRCRQPATEQVIRIVEEPWGDVTVHTYAVCDAHRAQYTEDAVDGEEGWWLQHADYGGEDDTYDA